MDLVKLAFQTTAAEEKHTKFIHSDTNKVDINAAVGLLGLRYCLAPRTSTPIDMHFQQMEATAPSSAIEIRPLSSEAKFNETPKFNRPPVCRNILSDLLHVDSLNAQDSEDGFC